MTALVDGHPHLGVECVLRELSIASSTYYRWRRAEHEPCERRRRDVELTEQIKEIHAGPGGIYGSPSVHAVLKREGTRVGRKRVERLMREAEIAGISPRRMGFTRRDPKATLAPDLVERDFTAPAPNRLWVTDLTMITTGEGPLWLPAIRDAFSRRVVAWETSTRADADLVLTTLEYALASREVTPGTLVHHVGHGCQYTSVKLSQPVCSEREFRRPWDPSGTRTTTPSPGTSGCSSKPNASAAVPSPPAPRPTSRSSSTSTASTNSRRIQKQLGYLSPIESEEKHHANQATTERTNLKPRQPALTS
ncbi:IS3 family transposase [Streptomyces murinus]|uniref:IS3 family transposase n=1 Tax=Streptomyces murinus TaxID=33900 RepID=UPI0038056485